MEDISIMKSMIKVYIAKTHKKELERKVINKKM